MHWVRARSRARPAINHESLREKGFDDTALAAVEAALASAFDIKFTFNKWTLGEDFCVERLGIAPGALDDPAFELLAALGFARAEIDAANSLCCGAMTSKGCRISSRSIWRCSTAPTRAAAPASAHCRWEATSG